MNILLFFLVQLSDGILNTETTPFPDPTSNISLYLSISLIDIFFFDFYSLRKIFECNTLIKIF